jgi:lipid A 3-O-deacylase
VAGASVVVRARGRTGRCRAPSLVAVALVATVAISATARAAADAPHEEVPAATAARAGDGLHLGAWELGLQAGYGFGMTNNSQYVTFLPRVGRVVWVHDGNRPGTVTFGVEGLFTRIYENRHAMELGGGLFLRWRMVRDGVRPYAELVGGMLYSDLRKFDLGSHLLFSLQPAVGLELPISDQLAVTAGYRFRHISNAGQSRENPGLNSSTIVVGVAYTL